GLGKNHRGDLARTTGGTPIKTVRHSTDSLDIQTVCEPAPPKGTHTQLPNFEDLDLRMAPRLRPQWGEKAIEFCKGKIYAIEQSRTPIPNSQEIIAAYKRRIKAVKKFMVGEL